MDSSFLGSTLSRAVTSPLRLYNHYLRPSSTTPTTTTTSTTSTRMYSSVPSPLTFLTSRYLLVSLTLAFLLHRIHHLVPPAHRNNRNDRVGTRLVQVGIRLPGILYMLKNSAALYLAATTTTTGRIEEIQRGSSYKLYSLKLLQSLTSFCGKGELGRYLESSSSTTSSSSSNVSVSINHSSLLWQTFLSITISILFESFVRNLSSDSPNLHSFNLLSFSFLLHVQSHTTTTKDSLLGEDEKQLYVYLLLTLLELSSLQLSYLIPYFTPRRRHNRRRQRRRPSSDEEEEDEEEEEEEVAPQVITTKKFRFLITLTFSVISQFLALKSYYSFYTDITTTTESPTVINNNNNNEGGGALIWFNKLPEICFELIVITSLLLKLSATLLRGEELSKENLLGAPIHWEYQEDFAVVLIKYTTALLKATRLSSLSYELSPLNVLPSTIATSLESIGFDLSSSSTRETYLEGGEDENESSEQGDGGGLRVRLERNGDVLLIEELIQSQEEENTNDNNNDGGLLRRRIGSRKSEALTYGFSTEIKSVQVEPLSLGGGAGVENSRSRGGREWNDDWGNGFNDNSDTAEYFETDYDSIGRLVQGGQRRNHLLKFFSVLSRISFYLVYLFIVYSHRIITSGLRFVGLRSFESKLKDTWRTRNQEERKQQQQQSRRGEGNEDDQDDDQDWKPSSDDDTSSDEEEEEGEEEEDENALALISDLSRPIDSSNDDDEHLTPTKLAPYLLAHHLSPSSSTTLTRRRYQSLLKSSSQRPSSTPEDSSLSQLDQAISSTLLSNTRLTRLTRQERESKRQEWRESRSNFCVVCTVEPRTVILWPCRCLALCEGCREALALRTTVSTPSSASTTPRDAVGAGTGGNLCPTCRSGVAGFSRIFIP